MIYEDIDVGTGLALGTHRFSAEEIRRFALAYDPQSFHVDEAAAKSGPFGAICASGWHTASAMMGLLARHFGRLAERARAAGREPVAPGPSPGFDDLKWLRPVYADDAVTFTGTILAKRESASRPAWGLVSIETVGVNQDGQPVFSITAHVFVARRPGGG
ncbi:MAG: MaoC family dehydratase [Bauldia sp.]|nr:MaoC family dehydratase [Bauldia sp.]